MDNKAIVITEIREFCKTNPEYTMAEIIFSIVNISFHRAGGSFEELKSMTDLELYKLIGEAKKREVHE